MDLSNIDYESAASEGYDIMPEGEYKAIISEAEEKTSKAGNTYLALTYEIVGEEMQGRKMWNNLNLNHDSEKVRAIAQSTLAAIAKAIGRRPESEQDLLDIPLWIKVKHKADKGSGEMRANIVKHMSCESYAEKNTTSAAPTGKKPWEK